MTNSACPGGSGRRTPYLGLLSADRADPLQEEVRAHRLQRPARTLRVLVVEDNPHIIEMYSYVLRKLGTHELKGKAVLEVESAQDGQEALAKLKATRFDLLLTDLYMPLLDGFSLVQQIRAAEDARRRLPVMAISAGGTDARDRALAVGVDVFLRKPVRFVDVNEQVKRLLPIAL